MLWKQVKESRTTAARDFKVRHAQGHFIWTDAQQHVNRSASQRVETWLSVLQSAHFQEH